MWWPGLVSQLAQHISLSRAIIRRTNTMHSVNVFYHINQMPARENISPDIAMQEREFQIGSVGFADSLGILAASLLAMPTELELCKAQVRRGKMLCKAV